MNRKRHLKCICKTPDKYTITKNGGIILGDDEFNILDDDMKTRLVERVKEIIKPQSVDCLQTFDEARNILDRRPKFLLVSFSFCAFQLFSV